MLDAPNDLRAPWLLPRLECEIGRVSRLTHLEEAPDQIPDDAARLFSNHNLSLVQRRANDNLALAAAERLIREVSELWPILSQRVAVIAIVACDDDCYDISHSDPQWPGVILTSIPPSTSVGNLRLAESILHEAMHHHLSALEKTVTLSTSESTVYSPWKAAYRPAIGVLHGLYVFGCIAEALKCLIARRALDPQQHTHARTRLSAIREEVNSVDRHALHGLLTPAGVEISMMVVDSALND